MCPPSHLWARKPYRPLHGHRLILDTVPHAMIVIDEQAIGSDLSQTAKRTFSWIDGRLSNGSYTHSRTADLRCG
jgi:hypothetical protein